MCTATHKTAAPDNRREPYLYLAMVRRVLPTPPLSESRVLPLRESAMGQRGWQGVREVLTGVALVCENGGVGKCANSEQQPRYELVFTTHLYLTWIS